ncbi:Signal transducer regulating beta-lactamase production, contains metallopeptidase domain [Zunongwangia mangrovi]|uniref:Signal transducer regulating beta-lactamase production, contains metallopeptidase domain n=1 Tax=Zunongwangia mangrovi TaxID=1334022 RepID=A0A1I1HGK5_9FLAO|nr:M56 family metallopeptidase [Zunongwangia mangrovi]SFC22712.1 Signal transducer regulating beta-lactamase production, contains metallopeptidase domain [Zunongwangia mangrovi]
MQDLLIYLLKSSALIGLFYFAYFILLKKETSFIQNRKFLIIGLVSSLVLPSIYFTQKEYVELQASNAPYVAFTEFSPQENMMIEEPTDWWQIGFYLYLLGLAVMSFKFLLQLYSLQRIINSGEKKRFKTLKLVRTSKDIKPFSFFKHIVFNPKKHNEKDLKLILKHEQIHAKQWHSLDVIFTSLLCVVFWFNPFIWLYKKVVVQNLEFLADQDAVANIPSKKEYQKALVMATVGLQPAMTNQFYQSFIKKRIIMLNKSKKKNTPWKTLLVVPFLCLFLYSFNLKTESIVLDSSNKERSAQDTVKNTSVLGNVSFEEDAEEDTEAAKNDDQKLPIRSKAFDVLGEKPLYILDDKSYTKSEIEGKAITFKAVNIMKPATAKQQYGEHAKDGAVLLSKTELIDDLQEFYKNLDKREEAVELQFLTITSAKKPEILTLKKEASSVKTTHKAETSSEEKKGKEKKPSQKRYLNRIVNFSSPIKSNDTLFILNGIIQKDRTFLNHFGKENIENITYLKGAKATALYGARASKYGVKIYTTKVKSSNLTRHNNQKTTDSVKVFRISDSSQAYKPLYVLNGEVISIKEFEKLVPKDIKAIYILKDKSATTKYKNKQAKYGVVEIYTNDYKGDIPTQKTSKVFVYTINPNETDAAINNMIKKIKKAYDVDVDIKKLHRNDEGLIDTVKMKARHSSSSSWNVTYSASNSSDHVETIYMVMDTENDDFKITNQKPGK